MTVTINDVRAAGFCVRGCRRWCEDHGFNFKDALKNGIPEDAILATGDEQGRLIVERKRERERG